MMAFASEEPVRYQAQRHGGAELDHRRHDKGDQEASVV